VLHSVGGTWCHKMVLVPRGVSVLQCVAVCCSVVQCVAVWCHKMVLVPHGAT